MTSCAYSIHTDGTFDLALAGVCLERCYPGFDDAAVHPVRVETGAGWIGYYFEAGCLTLRFEQVAEDHCLLRSELSGFDRAPRVVAPIFDAVIRAGSGFYHQGLGFGGPSGIAALKGIENVVGRPLNKKETAENQFQPLTSYLVSGLISAAGSAVAFGALAHADYLQKTVVRRRDSDFGLANRRWNRSHFTVEMTYETESIPLPARGLVLPDLHFISAVEPYEALQRLAHAIGSAMGCRGAFVTPKAKPPTYHFCSWYYGDTTFDRERLVELLQGLCACEPAPRLDTIQIDASYFPHVGDWLEASRNFPGTLREAARLIHEAGYVPGVWIAPFMVGSRSRVAKEHPDWLLRDLNDRPIERWQCYLGNRQWGLDDEEVYPLDTSHPEAFAYLRTVFETFREWGFAFYKTDFMDWGLYDSDTVRRYTPGKTGVQYLRELLVMIREAIGEEAYWLGCILPFPPSLGLVDGMRIGNDLHPVWHAGTAGNMIQEMLCDQYFNQIWWQNDPDVLYLRDFHSFLTREENESLAYLAAMSGGSINTSDPIPLLKAESRALWEFIEPTAEHFVGTVPRWAEQVSTKGAAVYKILTRKGRDGSVAVLVFNGADERRCEMLDVRELAVFEPVRIYRWHPGGAEVWESGCVNGRISVELKAHQSILLYLSIDGTPPPAKLLGASERVTDNGDEPEEHIGRQTIACDH